MDVSTQRLDELNLKLSSVLGDLPLWDTSLEVSCVGNSLIKLFDNEPLMPGVILTKNHDYAGMISRRRFFEFMSRPYSLGLFNERAIENLYDFVKSDTLIMGADTKVVDATKQALSRNSEFVYEPIVVTGNKLLDIQQLLLANSKIHALTLAQLEEAQKQSQEAEFNLHESEQRYVELLQKQKTLALEELNLSLVREVISPAKLVVGNLVHASRYTQELIQLVGLYQKYYPHPVEEIQIVAERINVSSVSNELPQLLSVMKGYVKKIQEFGGRKH
ncbi:hypothetical protein DSM106972_054730 [Dulcicalothrix desertica PCC 7102]|uniref:Uncharacterized protein n=1 Tax=Dulcicalothrix desertica PCC 7102 TaxID=232991 RepID=A0A433VAN3_9CYAN|nr:hypothetical protein [Dulcicalothrix desertica]RUT03165.1 hypothetical protein DSM106972_054730 [Dulcicalothrix desertica PCC 7102]TWH53537.1 hypothetical protein CAL7102_01498 [Dulcicalothrix desertica PCC 7102]